MTIRSALLTVLLFLLFMAAFLGPLLAARAFGACRSHACWQRVHEKRAARWCRRHEVCIWRHRFHAESVSWQRWARATGWCESRNRAHIATGNGYYGALQFDLRTWREAGGWGSPAEATIYEQYVRAIELAQRVGTGRWPVCG